MDPNVKIKLRSKPADFSNKGLDELSNTIKKYNFFCKGYEWNKDFSNDSGSSQNEFFDNLDGTVTDMATGLMWQKAHRPVYGRWKDAKAYAEQLNAEKFCGYTDWRLPTIEECCSLFTNKRENDGLFLDPLFTNRMWLWTSDVKDVNQDLIWNANFLYGSVYWIDSGNGQDIRVVRTAVQSYARQFYQDHISLLRRGNIEYMISQHYCDDAEIVTYRGVYTGHDMIMKNFNILFPQIFDTITEIKLNYFSELDDTAFWKNSMISEKLGSMDSEEAIFFKNGKIFRHIILGRCLNGNK